MISKFWSMEEEKRNRIIDAAMEEFALKGYKEAKTDNIVKNAGISKGLLFNYFGTKENLFLFIFEYAMDICEKQYLEQIDMDEDIFERVRKNGLLKIKLYQENPDLFNFLISADLKDMNENNEIMQKRKAAFFKKAYARAFGNYDTSKFKEGIDTKQAVDIIIWTMEGYVNRIKENFVYTQVQDVDYDAYATEIESCFSLLKNCFYK